VWRSLNDRENCTLDIDLPDQPRARWHIKRYAAIGKPSAGAEAEVAGHQRLTDAEIPTLKLVGWGRLGDGRSFVITDDLKGYEPADKLIESGRASFEALSAPTAALAARLHRSGLHHRDLYLCHFFVKVEGGLVQDLRLIDVARVAELRGLLRTRWIIKDLSQFCYSTLALPVTDAQRMQWLEDYARQAGGLPAEALRAKIQRKLRWIARHDRALRRRQPNRNISIPD
jgi:heptose I phosphotransferase